MKDRVLAAAFLEPHPQREDYNRSFVFGALRTQVPGLR